MNRLQADELSLEGYDYRKTKAANGDSQDEGYDLASSSDPEDPVRGVSCESGRHESS